MTTTDCAVLEQLRKSRVNTIKPLRIELQPSPYSTYTQKQLDMRRKAEILQYSAVSSNTKTNNLTKKEKFALIAKGTTQTISDSISTTNVCDNPLLLVPTSSSDVPGPIEYLYNDPTVPLYNPSSSVNSKNGQNYISTETTYTSKWEIDGNSNIFCTTDEASNSFSTLYIRDAIDAYVYKFSMTIPLSIDISGTLNTTKYNSDLDFSRNDVSVSLSTFECEIYYNDVLLNNTSLTNPVVPTYDTTNLTSFTIHKSDTDASLNFNATIYVGEMIIGNIQLFTSTPYVYDIVFKTTVNININDDDYAITDYFTETPTTYVIVNPTNDYIDISNNCIITGGASWSESKTFAFDGTIVA
jgi:hypothetical protein